MNSERSRFVAKGENTNFEKACYKTCVGNANGVCKVVVCRGPIWSLHIDRNAQRTAEKAANQYDMLLLEHSHYFEKRSSEGRTKNE